MIYLIYLVDYFYKNISEFRLHQDLNAILANNNFTSMSLLCTKPIIFQYLIFNLAEEKET